MYQGTIKVRGVIIENWKIFLCKLAKAWFYCLPWWTLETWESLVDCLEREMIEEIGVKPKIWWLVYVNEFVWDNGICGIDFWFNILNVKDYYNINLTKTSHGFELSETWFYDLEWIDFKPSTIKSLLEKWNKEWMKELIIS